MFSNMKHLECLLKLWIFIAFVVGSGVEEC
jgi:hypothetical protein